MLLLILTLIRIYQHKLQQFAKGLAQIAKYADLEKKSNCFLRLTIGIEALLKHQAVGALFNKLQSSGTITGEITRDDFASRLLRNYRQKFNTDEAAHEVAFNIKNNLLWKNGEIEFDDAIYHELFIPYDDPDGLRKIVLPPGDDFQRKLEASFETEGISAGLTIRAFVVNGIIKLQIGRFSKRLSPEVVKKGLDIYKTYETITAFPLLYLSW